MNEIKEIVKNAVVLFNTTEKALKKIENYKKLVIIDTASEKVIRKARQTTKGLMVEVNTRRGQNYTKFVKEFKEKNNGIAEGIQARLTPVYDNLDGKIKAVEEKRDKAKNEKIAAEQERLKYINLSMKALSNLATAGDPLFSSEQLEHVLAWIKEDDLEEDEFQEFLERAQKIKLTGIKNTQTALDNRIKLEEETAKLEKQREAQEKETARLDKINAEALKALQVQKDTLDAESKTLTEEKAKLKKEKAEAEKIRLLAIEKKEAAYKLKEDIELANAFNNQIDYGQELATELDLIIYSETWTEAHKQNNVMNLGIERAAEMEEKYQEDLKFDKNQLMFYASKLLDTKRNLVRTYQAKSICTRIEEKTDDLYSWIISEANSLTE